MGAVLGVAVTSALAAEPNATPAETTPRAPVVVATAPSEATKAEVTVQVDASKLPADAAEIVKLSRAKVSEDVIQSFIQNSKSSYNLSSDDILRMRNEGVSDRVIGAILSHHAATVEVAKQPEAPAPVHVEAGNPTAPVEGQPGEQPPVVTAPLTPSDSAIGYPPAAYGYPYYPYYYGGPVVAFGFGFPGCYYGHGYYGHYHGHGGIVVHGGGGGGHHH